MSKIKNVLMLFVLMIITLSVQSFAATTAKVTVDDLRLRKEDSMEADTITLLKENTKLEILEEKEEFFKVKVVDTGKEGYLSKDYVAIDEEQEDNKDMVDNSFDFDSGSGAKWNKRKKTSVNTKLYTLPVISSSVIETIEAGQEMTTFEEISGWIRVVAGNKTGWMRTLNLENIAGEPETTVVVQNATDDIQEEPPEQNNDGGAKTETVIKTGYISVDYANVREEANTTSKIVTTLVQRSKVDILSERGDWYEVKVDNKTGYVRNDLVVFRLEDITSRSSSNRVAGVIAGSSESSELGNQIADFALQFYGDNYVYGGASPGGFDCSGLVYYVFKQFGYNINRTADNQANNGVAIDKSELQRGDVVFFTSYGKTTGIGHCRHLYR